MHARLAQSEAVNNTEAGVPSQSATSSPAAASQATRQGVYS